jgi:hypothetical protein
MSTAERSRSIHPATLTEGGLGPALKRDRAGRRRGHRRHPARQQPPRQGTTLLVELPLDGGQQPDST